MTSAIPAQPAGKRVRIPQIKMQITTSTGTMNLNDEEIPSIDDMNDIISSVTADDDNGAQFQRLCDASTGFPAGLSNAQFEAECVAWLTKNPATK